MPYARLGEELGLLFVPREHVLRVLDRCTGAVDQHDLGEWSQLQGLFQIFVQAGCGAYGDQRVQVLSSFVPTGGTNPGTSGTLIISPALDVRDVKPTRHLAQDDVSVKPVKLPAVVASATPASVVNVADVDPLVTESYIDSRNVSCDRPGAAFVPVIVTICPTTIVLGVAPKENCPVVPVAVAKVVNANGV